MTRALNTLGALGYLRRERDQDDRRNVFVVRTSNGADFLEGFKRNLREGGESAAAHRPIIGQARPSPTTLRASRFPARQTRPTPYNAYRRTSPIAARGQVIASHYAEPFGGC